MSQFVITNVSTYKAIAIDAHAEMHKLTTSARRYKGDGSAGWIVTFDPEQKSFKQAMIAIVFTGIWLEALLHLLIVRDHGLEKFKEYDRKSHTDKMIQVLGCSDSVIIKGVERFKKCRNELVHEKAHLDSEKIKKAQAEADNVHRLLLAIDAQFKY